MFLLAATAFPTEWVAGGASVALVAALVAALLRINTLGNRQVDSIKEQQKNEIDRLNKEVSDLRTENRRCETRLNKVILVLQRNQLEIPPGIFDNGVA